MVLGSVGLWARFTASLLATPCDCIFGRAFAASGAKTPTSHSLPACFHESLSLSFSVIFRPCQASQQQSCA